MKTSINYGFPEMKKENLKRGLNFMIHGNLYKQTFSSWERGRLDGTCAADFQSAPGSAVVPGLLKKPLN